MLQPRSPHIASGLAVAILLGVQFDDQLYVDVLRYLVPFGIGYEYALHLVGIELQPGVLAHFLGVAKEACGNHIQVLRLAAHRYHVAGAKKGGRNVGQYSIHDDVLVRDQLTGSAARRRQAEAVNGIVQTGFQQLEQHIAGNAFAPGGFFKSIAELALQEAVGVLGLLLFHQLDRIVGALLAAAGVTMLTGRVLAFFESPVETVN